MKYESLLTGEVTARRATDQDVDFIITICRKCLPDQRMWQGPMYRAQKWWRSLINKDFCELWIFVDQDARIGFCKLDKDTGKFEAHKAAFQPTLIERLCTLIVHPYTFLTKGIRRISAPLVSNCVIGNGSRVPNEVCRFIWIRPMAIVPEYQRQGKGSLMMAFICRRTRHLAYHGIKLQVDRENRQAISYYEKTGFAVTAKSNYYLTITKFLEAEPFNKPPSDNAMSSTNGHPANQEI